MANFSEIDEARRVLGLGEAATLKEIKRAYRALSHRHHPDKRSGVAGGEDGIMKKINWAYKLISEYCSDYKYSFKEVDVARAHPEEEYIRNWRNNWFDSL